MTKMKLLAAAVCGCVTASSAFGGFTVTNTRTSVDATLDRIDMYALNDGVGTGTGLTAAQFTSVAVAGHVVWHSTSSGNWNPLNPTDAANRTQFRIDPDDVSSSFLASKTPGANQPLATQYGASTVALGTFTVTIGSLSGAIPPQTAQGNLFASLFVSKDYTADIGGAVGGSTGEAVRFGSGFPLVPPVLIHLPYVYVTFGQVVSNGASFSFNVKATDANSGDSLSLAVSPVAGVSNVTVTPASSLSPGRFTVTGRVDYSLNGREVVVPIRVTDGYFTSTSSFRLIVTPEPTMLSLLAASAFVRRRR